MAEFNVNPRSGEVDCIFAGSSCPDLSFFTSDKTWAGRKDLVICDFVRLLCIVYTLVF